MARRAEASREIALLSLLLGACSMPDPAHHSAAPAPASRGDAGLLALIETHCGGCHHERSRLPNLGVQLRKDRDLSLKAALMVGSGAMPPPPATFPPGERAAVIDGLCARAGVRPSICAVWSEREAETPFALHPLALLRSVSPATPGEGPGRQMLTSFRAADQRVVLFDGALLAFVAALAVEHCAGLGPRDDPDFARCVAASLARENIEFPRPNLPGGDKVDGQHH